MCMLYDNRTESGSAKADRYRLLRMDRGLQRRFKYSVQAIYRTMHESTASAPSSLSRTSTYGSRSEAKRASMSLERQMTRVDLAKDEESKNRQGWVARETSKAAKVADEAAKAGKELGKGAVASGLARLAVRSRDRMPVRVMTSMRACVAIVSCWPGLRTNP